MRITNTDTRSYHNKEPSKVLPTQEKEKKDKYLKACHEKRKDLTPLVYSDNGTRGREAKSIERWLALELDKKLTR